MATNLTFDSLVSDIQNYLERGQSPISDPVVFAQIPRIINNAERKLIQALKWQGTLEVLNDPTGFTPGTSVIPKPDRWRQTVSFSYGQGVGSNERTLLLPRSYEYCRNYWSNDAIQDPSQPPAYYADYDLTHWLIAPTSPGTYPTEILCYLMPPLLSEENQTNVWTQYAPTAILYASLLRMQPFLKDDTRINTWQAYYQFELATLTKQDLGKLMDRTAQRDRP